LSNKIYESSKKVNGFSLVFLEIPKHLSAAGRQGITLKKIGCIFVAYHVGVNLRNILYIFGR
jgi:hypothetical protein